MGGVLDGKVAIVTGGAAGLGRATVERFVEEGSRVVVADVDDDRGQELAKEFGADATFQHTDVASADDIQVAVDRAVDTFGGLHVMFNNAGVAEPLTSFLKDDFASFERVMAVNILGVMVGSQRAARHMAKHGGGSIINNSSIGGIAPGGGVMSYRASKAAVTHISRSLAVELGAKLIRVNCIAPGHIPTEITHYDMDAVVQASQPFPRLGSAVDVANAVVYLASDQSAQITGVVLPIDGGTTAGAPIRPLQKAKNDDQ